MTSFDLHADEYSAEARIVTTTEYPPYAEIRIKGTSDLYRCGSVRAENKVVLYGRNPADLRQVADVLLKMAYELERLGVGVPA